MFMCYYEINQANIHNLFFAFKEHTGRQKISINNNHNKQKIRVTL